MSIYKVSVCWAHSLPQMLLCFSFIKIPCGKNSFIHFADRLAKRLAQRRQCNKCLLPIKLFNFFIIYELSSMHRCLGLYRRAFLVILYLPRFEATWLSLNLSSCCHFCVIQKCYLLFSNHFSTESIQGQDLLTTGYFYYWFCYHRYLYCQLLLA